MKLLTRYILKESFAYFCVSLFAFTGILLTIRMLRFASLIINKGVGLGQIGMVFVAIIPTFLEIALPMATLLGIMLAFARLSKDSEIIVIRGSGISLYQLILPVVCFGLVSTLMGFLITLKLEPWGHRKLSETLFEIAKSKSTAGLSEGIFNKLGDLTLYSEQIDHSTGELKRVLIDDKRNKNGRSITLAKRGQILSNENQQNITFLLNDGEIHESVSGRYVYTRYNQNTITIDADDIFDPDAGRKGRLSQQMSLAQIGQTTAMYQNLIEQNRDKEPDTPIVLPAGMGKPLLYKDLPRQVARLRVEVSRRLSTPFAALILALVAMPLGIHPPRAQRTWGLGLSAVFGLGVFVFYYALLSVGLALAESGHLAPFVALWIPNVTAALVGIYALRKTGSEKWQSIADGVLEIVNFWVAAARRLRPA